MPDQFPRVQRHVPPPFARPSANLGQQPGVRRDWRTVPVASIREGDIIPGIGLVTLTKRVYDASSHAPWTITVEGGDEGKAYTFVGNDTVFAFTVVAE